MSKSEMKRKNVLAGKPMMLNDDVSEPAKQALEKIKAVTTRVDDKQQNDNTGVDE